MPSSWSQAGHHHARHTSNTKQLQLPRIPLPSEDTNGKVAVGDLRSKRFHRRGLTEAPALRQQRQHTRDRTLEQIDVVLTQLNEHTNRATMSPIGASSLRQQQQQQGSVASHAVSVGQARQHMEHMRSFSKPNAGAKKLMNMVDSIVEEFNT